MHKLTYAEWAHQHFGFAIPPSVRSYRELPRQRPWTKAEIHRLQEVWHQHGQSQAVASILKRSRDDVRAAVHMTGLRNFGDAARAMQRDMPPGYYGVFDRWQAGDMDRPSWTIT